MKTITVTIEEDTLKSTDEIAKKSPSGSRNRSRIIRAALKEFVAKELKRDREAREREILQRHRARLEKQARALIAEQAKP